MDRGARGGGVCGGWAGDAYKVFSVTLEGVGDQEKRPASLLTSPPQPPAVDTPPWADSSHYSSARGPGPPAPPQPVPRPAFPRQPTSSLPLPLHPPKLSRERRAKRAIWWRCREESRPRACTAAVVAAVALSSLFPLTQLVSNAHELLGSL
ncbi:filamin-binding LIM protein 1-like [Trachypithecus francoisi]|uniref:filamin-binding LIM protein 1-like n=1 Tax=Trachypithecus francoisi TaxID=54180 RepID=UPI00141AD4CC|nr:filamin-binding LIM protein 1-like [Trachypithecus francoisi]